MANNGWTWANLSGEQLGMLHEGEQTLGAAILLAYQQDQNDTIQVGNFSQSSLQVASLNESQIECLQGLEKNMQAIVVAYQEISP